MKETSFDLNVALHNALVTVRRDVEREVGRTKKLRAFLRFHHANPVVYTLVERYSLQASTKRGLFGIKAVWERLRWYYAFETDDPEFKLCNNHHAYYARLFMAHHPEHAGLFKLRALKPEGGG